jgi:hypothetical protein
MNDAYLRHVRARLCVRVCARVCGVFDPRCNVPEPKLLLGGKHLHGTLQELEADTTAVGSIEVPELQPHRWRSLVPGQQLACRQLRTFSLHLTGAAFRQS